MCTVAGAAVLSLAACGSSDTAKPAPSASPTGSTSAQAQAPTRAPSTAPDGTGKVAGLIASVSGNTAQLTGEKGNATVDFGASTAVSEVTPAALTDVSAGSCVSVRPAHGESEGGQSITARSVRISTAVDGKCAPGSATPGPSPSNGPGGHRGVGGTVASVAGDTITVNGSDGAAPTTVAVTDKTRYTKQVSASTQSIAAGKCMTAQGSQDGSGALQATTINLRPANNGQCTGAPHHGHGG
jgi:Domain of unknown function (DUF5666)